VFIQHSTLNTQHSTFGFQEDPAALTGPSITEEYRELSPIPPHPHPIAMRADVVAGHPDCSAMWRDADHFDARARCDEGYSGGAAGGKRRGCQHQNCNHFLHGLLLPLTAAEETHDHALALTH
jgi:hypothetical protein